MARDVHRVSPRASGPDLASDLDLDLAALARTGPGPYRITAELPTAWIAAVLAHTDAEASSPGRVEVEVTSIGGGSSVLVRGTLAVDFTVPCARCLEPAPVSTAASGELCVHYVRGAGDAMEDEEGHEWSEDEASSPDQRPFVGTRLDLRPLVEEQILVAYPMRALCSRGEACRGLCMHCGANLNEQAAIPGAEGNSAACTNCGAGDAQVPIVALPDASLDPSEAASAEAAESWKSALRGIQVPAAGSGKRKKPRD
ncbi:MAG: DUF177 domain-containing protein [Myxococcales bacterium]|nr:DUF177 domain-containing protein [Myxococcales bacterium]